MDVPLGKEALGQAVAASEMLPDGLVVVLGNWQVRHLNGPAERISGLRLQDGLGRDVREVLPLQERSGELWWEAIDPWGGLNIRSGHRERLLLLPGGREVLATARYLRPGRNVPAVALLLGLRSAEGRQRAETEHAALISTVAHELRSPLTGVKGFSSTLLSRWDRFTDEQKRFMVETIQADADRLARLITDLLDVSRLDAGRLRLRPEPVDVEETFRRHITRLVAAGHDTERFVIDVGPELPPLWADADRLDQVLANLLENALRHGRGTVTLGARSGLMGDGAPAVDVTVSDEGDGIDERARNLVFSRFWHDAKQGGTGLGLYLVKGIAEAHGGVAKVEEGPAGGALIRIRLPSVEPEYLRL